MTDTPDADTYALASKAVAAIPAPAMAYRPPVPKTFKPRIGLIGTGGIAEAHLDAYRTAGWEVAALCNRTLSKAEQRRDAFYGVIEFAWPASISKSSWAAALKRF